MKKTLHTLLLLLYAQFSHAQKLIIDWTKFIGGDSCYTICNDAIKTADKGIVVTGITRCSNKGDIPFSSYASPNAYVMKLDKLMNIEWVKIYGGNAEDDSKAICEAQGGGYAIVVTTTSADGDIINPHGSKDICVIRIDDLGNILWSKDIGSSFSEEATDIISSDDGGFIVLGTSNGDGDDIPFHYTTSQFVQDWCLAKLDKDGNIRWVKTLGGTGDENTYGKLLKGNNGYYIASATSSKDYDCLDTSWHPASTNTHVDYCLLKVDTSGQKLWSKTYGGSNGEIILDAIVLPEDGSILITGNSYSNDYLATGNHDPTGNQLDTWTILTDSLGNLIWAQMFGSSKDDGFYSSISQKDSNTFYNLSSELPGQFGGMDGRLLVIDKAGKILTSKSIGGSNYDVNVLAIAYNDEIYTIGYSLSEKFNEGLNFNRHKANNDVSISKLYYFPTSISIFEGNSESELKLYPNPVLNTISISIPRKIHGTEARLSVIDGTGRTIIDEFYVKIPERIDKNISEWHAGIYNAFVTTYTGTKYSKQFVKN